MFSIHFVHLAMAQDVEQQSSILEKHHYYGNVHAVLDISANHERKREGREETNLLFKAVLFRSASMNEPICNY